MVARREPSRGPRIGVRGRREPHGRHGDDHHHELDDYDGAFVEAATWLGRREFLGARRDG